MFKEDSKQQQQPQQEQMITTFHLQGLHSEDTISQTAEALGWNTTTIEPLNNGSIFVQAKTLQ